MQMNETSVSADRREPRLARLLAMQDLQPWHEHDNRTSKETNPNPATECVVTTKSANGTGCVAGESA